MRISGSNAGYTMFRDSVNGTGYPLHSPVSLSLPLPCVTVCHHVSTVLYQSMYLCLIQYFLVRILFTVKCLTSRSQWPRGLRRRSAAARLLRSWVRIPPRAWMFVCCVLSGRGLCDELITRPESLRRADHSSRGVLPTVVCRCV